MLGGVWALLHVTVLVSFAFCTFSWLCLVLYCFVVIDDGKIYIFSSDNFQVIKSHIITTFYYTQNDIRLVLPPFAVSMHAAASFPSLNALLLRLNRTAEL